VVSDVVVVYDLQEALQNVTSIPPDSTQQLWYNAALQSYTENNRYRMT
jgi:hypothetical protein